MHINTRGTDLHKNAPSKVPREYLFFQVQIVIQFHFPPWTPPTPSTLNVQLESSLVSFERHLFFCKSPGKALHRISRPFWPTAPPGTGGTDPTLDVNKDWSTMRFDLGHVTCKSQGKARHRISGHFWPFFAFGLILCRASPGTGENGRSPYLYSDGDSN